MKKNKHYILIYVYNCKYVETSFIYYCIKNKRYYFKLNINNFIIIMSFYI